MPAVHEDLDRRPRRRPAAERHRHALGRHRAAQGRGPPHRLARASPPRHPAATPTRRPCASSSPPTASPWPSSRARLGELERLRRGSLSFLVEASDLLAGTLDRDQTLALMAQMTVPDPGHLVRRLHHRRPVLRAVSLLRAARGRGAHRRPQGPAVEDRPARPGPHARRPHLDGARRGGPPGGAAASLRSLGLGDAGHRSAGVGRPSPRPPRSAARRSSCRWSPATASSAC